MKEMMRYDINDQNHQTEENDVMWPQWLKSPRIKEMTGYGHNNRNHLKPMKGHDEVVMTEIT